MKKKILIALLAIVLAVVLLVGGYAAYIFIDYSRLEDNIPLEVRANDAPTMPAEGEKTIVSWNMGFGAYSDDYSFFMDGGVHARALSREDCEGNIAAMLDALGQENADLMLLQELDVKGTRSYDVDQVAMAEAAFPRHSAVYAQNYDSSYLFYPFHQPIGANRGGILTLSAGNIESALRRSLPIEQGFSKFFDLDRCYSVSRIPLDNGRTLALYNLHLSAYTSDPFTVEEQLRLLLADMAAEYAAGSYVIAGGDFNKDLWGDSGKYSGVSTADASWCRPLPLEMIPEGITLVSSLDEEKLVLSCRNADKPYEKGSSMEITIDGFLVSDNVQVNGCEVIDMGFANSDHNPVRMRFTLL